MYARKPAAVRLCGRAPKSTDVSGEAGRGDIGGCSESSRIPHFKSWMLAATVEFYRMVARG
ncbi:MAG: hypothetical protein LBK73_00035 [Treponema sp.]|nr:hypothetical protein [Treponema sp.]